MNVIDIAYPLRNAMFRLYLVVVKNKQTAFFPLRLVTLPRYLQYSINPVYCLCVTTLQGFPGRWLTENLEEYTDSIANMNIK